MYKLILFFLLLSQAALGTTRYIATTGNDTNNTCAESTSVSLPKRNFKGSSGAIACMSAGDTLIVKAGTYTETDIGLSAPGQLPSGISDSQRTILQAASGETVTIRPTGGTGALFIYSRKWITVDGIIFDGVNVGGLAVYIGRPTDTATSSTDITFQNVEIMNAHNSGISFGFNQYTDATPCNMKFIDSSSHDNGQGAQSHGIYTSCRNVLVEGSTFYNNPDHGIHVYAHGVEAGGNAWTNTSDTIVRNNIARNNGETGIGIYNGNNLQVYNNLVYNNGIARGIAVRYACTNCKVYNNTIYSNDGLGAILVDSTNSTHPTTNAIIQNNILHSNGTPELANSVASTIISNNLCPTGCSVSEANASNIFTNPGTLDLSLKAGSPAIGNASNLSATFTTDYDGITRSVPWDIGAYEYASVAESITLNSPNGGENWLKTASQTIGWTRNNFTNTRVRADRNNDGTFEETINASTSATSINWTPGGTASSTVKLEACDAADGTPCDISNAVFSITDAAGGTVTRIISENLTGSFIGDVNGVEDTTLWSDQATTNFQNSSLNANKTATVTNNMLLRFTGLSQIPSNATVSSVTVGLNLQAQSGGSTTGIFDLRKMLRAWLEPQATWNIYNTGNNWATAGGTGAATDRRVIAVGQLIGVGTTLQFYTVTDSTGTAGGLLALVREWVDGTDLNNGFHIERNGSGADGRLWTWTGSEGTDGLRPYMSVTYSTGASTISVVEPFSDSHFFPGQTVPIRWGSQGVSGNVEILLARDGGINFNETIDANFPFDGSDFPWLVTIGSCSACKIKVTSLNDPTVFGISAPFRIAGSRVRAR